MVAQRASGAETIESFLGRIHIGWVLFALFVVHAVLTIGFLYPTALFDEFGYLAYGRALSGVDAALVNLRDSASQHALYGLFLAPLFRLSSNFADVYRAALLANCVLAAFTSLSVYGLGRELGLSRGRAVAAAIAVACFPSFLLLPTFAVGENLFVLLFTGSTWVGVRLLRAPSFAYALLFGAGVGAVYATHSSGVVVVVAALVALIYAAAAKRLSVAAACASGTALAVAVAGAIVLDRHIFDLLYGRSNDVSVDLAVAGFAQPSVWSRAFANLAGSVFATSLATFGLFPAGCTFAVERLRHDSLAPIYAFVVLCVLGCLIGASVFLGNYPEGFDRPNTLFAARYLEGVVIVPIVLGFVMLTDTSRRRRFVVVALASIAVSALACLGAATHLEWFDGPGRRINMIAFASFLALFGHATLVSVAALAVVVIVTIVVMRRSSWVTWCAVLTVAGVFAGVLERQRAYLPVQSVVSGGAATLPLADAVRFQKSTELAYDMDAFEPSGYALVELQDPHIRLMRFSRSQTGVPAMDMVITSRAWDPDNYRLVMCESFADSCLWVRQAATAWLDYAYGPRSKVTADGLYGIEGDESVHYRWTNGDARFHLKPSAQDERRNDLLVVLQALKETPVEIHADGRALFRGRILGQYRGRFPVKAAPRMIEIRSTTFVPPPLNGFTRRLGVEVRELRLDR